MRNIMTISTEQRKMGGWLPQVMCLQSTALTLGLAVAFLISSPARVSAKAYDVITSVGGAQSWGIIFLLCAVLTGSASWHKHRTYQAGTLAVSGLSLILLALTFGIAAYRYETANLTAPVVYGWVGFLHLTYAWWIHTEQADHEE
jgi:hypothetical protein